MASGSASGSASGDAAPSPSAGGGSHSWKLPSFPPLLTNLRSAGRDVGAGMPPPPLPAREKARTSAPKSHMLRRMMNPSNTSSNAGSRRDSHDYSRSRSPGSASRRSSGVVSSVESLLSNMSLGGVMGLLDDYYGCVSQADLLGNLGPVSAPHGSVRQSPHTFAPPADPAASALSNSAVVEACAKAAALAASDGVKLETLLMQLRRCDERHRLVGSSASEVISQVRQEMREVDQLLSELRDIQVNFSSVADAKQRADPTFAGFDDGYGGLASKLGTLMRWQQKTLKSPLVNRAKKRLDSRPVQVAYRYEDAVAKGAPPRRRCDADRPDVSVSPMAQRRQH